MTKQLASKLKDTTKSLNAYKITEEFKIEKEEEAHKLEADAEEDKAKAKKLEKDADYIDDVDEAKEDKAENIAAIETDKNDACKAYVFLYNFPTFNCFKVNTVLFNLFPQNSYSCHL